MVRIEFDDSEVQARLAQLMQELSPAVLSAVVERAAHRCRAELEQLTPQGRTGATRRAWRVIRGAAGEVAVANDSRTMLFLEHGTGQSTGGYIYPRSKRRLFVPLTARAAASGWMPGLRFGTDYVLARRVRGLPPRHLVRDFGPRAEAILAEEISQHLDASLR